jgi:hypothetical protein
MQKQVSTKRVSTLARHIMGSEIRRGEQRYFIIKMVLHKTVTIMIGIGEQAMVTVTMIVTETVTGKIEVIAATGIIIAMVIAETVTGKITIIGRGTEQKITVAFVDIEITLPQMGVPTFRMTMVRS